MEPIMVNVRLSFRSHSHHILILMIEQYLTISCEVLLHD